MKLFLFNNDEKLIGTVSPLEGIQNEEINKIQTIECTVVYSELIEKASYIGHKDYNDNRIFHLYKIDHVTKTSTTDVKIVGVHTFFDDMESDGYVKDFRPTNRELVGVLTTILDGSRWQLGTVNIQRRFTGNFYYVTRKEAISKLIEATQIEIKPRLEFSRGKITGRYLDVFTRLGARNGKVFVHGRDLLTVSEKKSQGAIYTAVVGRGKGEETDTGGYGRRISFKDVEWRRTSGQPVDKPVGQEYVEIPAMTRLYGFEKGTKPRIKIVEFQDETDKEKLLRLSYEWLEKNSRMQVEYSAKVLNVGNLELGDTVGIFNPTLGIKYETRVFKVKRNLVNNKLTEFGIGDKVTTSPFSRTIELAKEMKNFQDDTVYWLDKIRERLSDKLINEDGYNYDLKADNEYKVPAGYYSFDKPIDQNPTKVVYMGAGKIAIADSKKPTGEWNWKTFLDGRGATLDLINTGVLKAGRIQSADGRSYWDLDTGEFHMEQSAINEAVKTAVNGKVQEIVGEVKKNLPTKEELKGKSSYLHKKYSDYADGHNMSDNSTLKYIGIYTGEKEQAPTNASEYSWTKIKLDGKLYKAYANSLTGLDFTLVEPDENSKLLAKNRPRVNIVNDNDISDIWQANMFISLQPNTKYTLTARAKGNSNKLWAYFRNNKTGEEYSWGQLEFRELETKSITFTTTEDVDDVLFKFVLVPEDADWTGIQIDWFTIHERFKRYHDFPADEPAQYHKYRYFGYVFKESTPVASDFEWFDLQQTSITNDKYTHIVYSDNADGSNFGREPKKYMGVARTTSPTQPTDKTAYKWFKVKGDDGVSSYIHRKYSDYSNGANMSDNSNLKYIGIYTGTSSTPPTTASSYSWSKIKGEDGANGVPGAKGADGRTPYFHTAYSNSPTGDRDFSLTNSTNKLYIGTYSDFELADSNDYRRYKWVKIKGEDGNNGRDGVNSYIHRKYSDNSSGYNMSDNSTLKYIGIYTGTSAIAPTLPSAYTWSKIKGEDGQQGVPGARGSDGRTSYLHTAYSNSATGERDFSTTNSNGKEYIGTYTDFEINDSSDYRRYKWIKIKGENAHTLTANLRLEGTYINGVTNNVKAYLDVFYDGQKITDGFNAQVKFKGGIMNTWSAFWNAKVDSTGFITNLSWGNKEQPHPIALEVIVLVTYNDLNTVVNARMDNIPDVVAIKEVVKQYKTFDSRIDRFNSTIGEVKQQVLANEEKRNLILGSRMLSENDYKVFGNKDIVIRLQSYEGLPYVTLFLYGKTSNVWQGIGFNTSVNQFKQGEKYSVRIPMLISSTTVLDNGGYVEIKNHRTGEVLWKSRLDTNDVERDKWVVREFTFTASKTMNTSDYSFWIFVVRNGLLTFGKPYMCAGDSLPKNYSPAPEDAYLQNSRLESSILQTKDEIGLKVSKNEVISAINLSVEKNSQGRDEGIVKIKGEVLADNIHGKTFTGSKFEVGKSGILDSQGNNLRISSPHDWNGSSGVGMQLRGRTDGKFNQGLNIYRVNDVRNPEEPLYTPDEVALTVFGEIRGALKVNTAPKSGKLTTVMARAVMSNTSTNTPFHAVGYPGATMWPITGIFLRSGGGPTQIWVNDGTGGNSTYGVNVNNMESDISLKENIQECKDKGLDVINQFKFHSFDWKQDKLGYKKPHTKIGLIAQEVQAVQEDLVYENPNSLALDDFRLLNIALKAIQELSIENTNLKSQLNEMNERINKLEDKINGNI
nr:MAG TPA: tail protein [Caudoviricetes sp.]